MSDGVGEYDFVVVANRLPVDRVVGDDGAISWRASPGGLVTALEPVMRRADGAWVGWSGDAGEAPEPFDADDMRLVPVPLSSDEVSTYYEGFSNDTLWPLYHDVIAVPTYHRAWWDAYVRVNRRFAEAAAAQASRGATVWVQDYQLQLTPAVLRELRPDLKIGFFNHIPFPPYELFAQMPWRREVVEGLLGADLLGFQRQSDANNFLRVCRRLLGLDSRRHRVVITDDDGAQREVHATAFPISIDTPAYEELAATPAVQSRVTEVRFELGAPRKLLLGVDRLDYTKGIMHRLKAYGELLDDGLVDPQDTVLVQVATPSRERVDSYRQLRDEIELAVGRINGEHGTIGHAAVHYLHHNQPRDEMSALYQAADVMLVTALRDGMNLVAKEYAASRLDERGVLVLSEFTGAADELTGAVLVNPHDIAGLKRAVVQALEMPEREQVRRMRQLRRRVRTHDVTRWAEAFLSSLETGKGSGSAAAEHDQATTGRSDPGAGVDRGLDDGLRAALDRVAASPSVLVALDFDGVLAPITEEPEGARALPASAAALEQLVAFAGVEVALVSGRAMESLRAVSSPPPGALLIASHGAEGDGVPVELTDEQRALLARISDDVAAVVAAHAGTQLEHKPAGVVLHTRSAPRDSASAASQAVLQGAATLPGVHAREGKEVVELSVVGADKGSAVVALRDRLTQEGAGTRPVVLFAGDDVTDEDAFRAMDPAAGDVGIKVGAGETAAKFRVDAPSDVSALLEHLVSALTSDLR